MNNEHQARAPRAADHREKRSLVRDRLRRTSTLGWGRIDTTIAMERFYWIALEEIARRHGMNWRRLVDLVLGRKPSEYTSRSGWLRLYIAGYFIFGARRDLPLTMAFMPEQGWSLRQLTDHFAAERERFPLKRTSV